MSSQRAYKIQAKGVARVVADAPIRQARDDEMLIKTVAVSLNPTDWKHIYNMPHANATVGCDVAGEVVEVGKDVKNFQKGDRVAGFIHGSNVHDPDQGAFAEYTTVIADLCFPIPQRLSFEEASTAPLGLVTACQGLYQSLELPRPLEPSGKTEFVLIYGGSTATGTLAIQLARLSGLRVLTTCSPRNNDLVKGLGAEMAFDYNDGECASKIRAETSGQLAIVMDCISNAGSAKICLDSIGPAGGRYSSLIAVDTSSRADVTAAVTIAYSATGRPITVFKPMPAKPDHRAFARDFVALTSRLMAEGKLQVHPPSVQEHGLNGISHGLERLKEGKVSGKKLVYRTGDA